MLDNDRYLFTNDCLKRYAYTKHVYGILERAKTGRLHCNGNASFIMAVSGNWGCGKTYFMNMLRLYLAGKPEENEDAANHKLYDENEICFIDAWESDLYENPLVPLFKEFAKTILKASATDLTSKKQLGEWGKTVMKFGKYVAKVEIPDAFGTVVEGSRKIRKTDADSVIEDIAKNDVKMARKMRELLEKALGDKQLLVIIDELDRCKPLYALRTLEYVKHLFNVKGINYVFSLDISQLRHTISQVYGEKFDSVGYLERFFDVTSYIPEVSLRDIMKNALVDAQLVYFTDEVRHKMYQMCHDLELTAREIQQVVTSFSILYHNRIKAYNFDDASLLYFYCTLLRYKYPIEFVHACMKEDCGEYQWIFETCSLRLMTRGASALAIKTLKANRIIATDEIDYYRIKMNDGYDKDEDEYNPDGLIALSLEEDPDNDEWKLKIEESLNGVLFHNDFANIKYICKLRLLRYILRNMELCDFSDDI